MTKGSTIKLNGSTIFDTNDFNQQVSSLQKYVTVINSNQLQVELRSTPGSGLTISIEGVDDAPPSLIINSPANGTFLNNPSVTVSGTASDSISWVSTVTVNAATAAFTGETYTSNIQLTEGTNTITVAATDAAGNSSNVSVSVVLDTIPPKITIDPVPSLTSKSQLTITGKIEDASPISSFTVNSSPVTLTNNTFTATVNLTEGDNSISIGAIDKAGNLESSTTNIFLDTIPPTVTISSPSNNAYLNTPTITVIGRVSDTSSGISSVVVNGVTAVVSSNTYTANIRLSEGANTVTITATDKAENTGSSTTIVNLDTMPPVISIISPVNGMTVNTGTVAVTGSIDDNMATVTVNRKNATISRGTFTADGLILAEGLNNITVMATDSIGNTDTATITVTYIVPNPAPVITIQYPLDGSTVYLPSVTVSGKVDDPTAIININGISAKTSNCQKPDLLVLKPEEINEGRIIIRDVPQYSVLAVKSDEIEEGPICFSGAINLVEGMNKVTVTATNSSGKSTTSIITVSAIMPDITTITYPTNYSTVTTNSITVTGTISNTATVSVNGINATVSGNTFTASSVPLIEGTNTVTVTATYSSGQTSMASVIVYKDTTAPVIKIPEFGVYNGVAIGAQYNDIKWILAYVYDTANSTPNVIINGTAATVDYYDYNQGYYYVRAPVKLVEGSNTITIKATDSVGNSSNMSIVVYYDKTFPVITVTSPTNSVVNRDIIAITGTIDDPSASIRVYYYDHDLNAWIEKWTGTVSGNTFEIRDVQLKEVVWNNLIIVARDTAWNETRHYLLLRIDTVAPAITITTPVDGSLVENNTIYISGTLSETAKININGKDYGNYYTGFAIYVFVLNEGQNTITVTATDAAGNTSSTAVTITYIPDTTSPVISITSPQDGWITNRGVIWVTGTIDDSSAVIRVNGMPVSYIVNNTFTAFDVRLTEGTNTITATATDPYGNIGSTSITVLSDRTPPTVLSTVPSLNETGVSPDAPITVTFNEAMATVSTGIFTLTSETGPVYGTVTYSGNSATFTPKKRLNSDTVYTAKIIGGLVLGVRDVAYNPLVADYGWVFKTGSIPIEITEPYDGATINKATAIIKGRINYQTQEVGITVNGVIAETNGNTWTAVVPLQIGRNTIEATATDITGNRYKHAITINTNSIQQPLTITTNPQSGIAPLNTTFSIDTSISNPITSYRTAFEGDGVIDLETTYLSNITHSYDIPGIYYPTFTVTDSQGNTYTEITTINVLDRTQMDVLLKSKWEGMKGALGSGDIATSVSYFDKSVIQKYSRVFTDLGSDLPNIAATLEDITLNSFIGDIAEYAIGRNQDGKRYIYFIYFMRDENGIWKIMGM